MKLCSDIAPRQSTQLYHQLCTYGASISPRCRTSGEHDNPLHRYLSKIVAGCHPNWANSRADKAVFCLFSILMLTDTAPADLIAAPTFTYLRLLAQRDVIPYTIVIIIRHLLLAARRQTKLYDDSRSLRCMYLELHSLVASSSWGCLIIRDRVDNKS